MPGDEVSVAGKAKHMGLKQSGLSLRKGLGEDQGMGQSVVWPRKSPGRTSCLKQPTPSGRGEPLLAMRRVMLLVASCLGPPGQGLALGSSESHAAVSAASVPLQQNPSLARGFPGWWPSWRAAVPSRKVLQKSPWFFGVRVQVQSLLDGIPKVCGAGGSAAVSPVLPSVSRTIFTHPNSLGAREGAPQQCEQRGRAWWWRGREDTRVCS